MARHGKNYLNSLAKIEKGKLYSALEAIKLVKETNIFDVYEGEHIEAGKKSVAINLVFQDPKGTLDEATVNKAMENILVAVEKEFNAVLRG